MCSYSKLLPYILSSWNFYLSCDQVAVPDLVEAAKDADILIFVVPHQFIPGQCKQLLGKIKKDAIGLSLIKGFDVAEGGGIALISHIITKHLQIPCSVLMGANLANEVADEKFCETTIGYTDKKHAAILRDMMQADHFRVVVVDDVNTVEICGALKVRDYFIYLISMLLALWLLRIVKIFMMIFMLVIEYRCLWCWLCWWLEIGW